MKEKQDHNVEDIGAYEEHRQDEYAEYEKFRNTFDEGGPKMHVPDEVNHASEYEPEGWRGMAVPGILCIVCMLATIIIIAGLVGVVRWWWGTIGPWNLRTRSRVWGFCREEAGRIGRYQGVS